MKTIRRASPFAILATAHGTLIVNHNDYNSHNGGRYGVGHQLFTQSCFDPEIGEMVGSILRIRKEVCGDNIVVVDGGANIGVYTVEWAKLMHGWGRVIAIEAQERIFYALAGNVAINNCFNATAIHAALGAETGSLVVPVPDYRLQGSFGSLELKQSSRTEFIGQPIDYDESRGQRVRLVSVDSLDLEALDFLKLDVEGMEMEVLAGAEASIMNHKPQILVEFTKSDAHEMRSRLEEWGYLCCPIGVNFLAVHLADPCRKRMEDVLGVRFDRSTGALHAACGTRAPD